MLFKKVVTLVLKSWENKCNETSVTVARNNNGSLTRQDTEVLIQPAAGSLVRTITME